ncbi:MFS domain-containing protein [Psidium guajava]|nr:MFS domain-containing protein [Psidium guajava]
MNNYPLSTSSNTRLTLHNPCSPPCKCHIINQGFSITINN